MVTPAAIRVLLPQASSSEQVMTKKNINLVITADLHYYIDDKEIAKKDIEPILAAMIANKAENEEMNVLLQADRNLSLQDVIDIIDIGNKVRVKMILFTQKP